MQAYLLLPLHFDVWLYDHRNASYRYITKNRAAEDDGFVRDNGLKDWMLSEHQQRQQKGRRLKQ